MKNFRSLFLFLIAIAPCSIYGQDHRKDIHNRIDSLIEKEMKQQNIPGLSLAVVNDGKTDYIKGYGFANLEHKVTVKPETIFQSGSVGKQFTAFAIMLLAEEGKLSLDDPISKFFSAAPKSWDSITVRNLLNHTGGFGDYPRNFDFRGDYTEDSIYQIIKQIPLKFKAGEASVYSNIGYATLGFIISKASGKFYGDYLKERVFEPLGMRTARVISERDIIANRAAGYVLDEGEIKNQEWVSPTLNTTADGSLYLTALDMVQWEAGLNSRKLLKPESYEAMWSPARLNNGSTYPYGYGWALDTVNGKKIIEHGGSWQGFESAIRRYPDEKLAVIVFANLSRSRPVKVARKVMELYHPEMAAPVLSPIKDAEPGITVLVKNFIEKLMANTLSADMFTPEFGKNFMPVSSRPAAFLKTHGKFLKPELLARYPLESVGTKYHYRLLFSEGQLELMITLTKDNKIASIEGRD